MKYRLNSIIKINVYFLLMLIGFAQPGISQNPDSVSEDNHALMNRIEKRWTGDLQQMRQQRRLIRVLVSYNDTNFFVVRGENKGMEYELLREYGRFLNRQPPKHRIKTNIVFIAVPFEELIPALREGRGDIAAAGLTITPERRKLVAFTTPYIVNVNEIIVTSKLVQGLKGLNNLAGRKVHVVAGSSYVQHLKRLNKQFKRDGLKPVNIVQVDKTLEAEDVLQMVNSGIVELTVVDHHIADLWSKVLTDLVLKKDLVINSGGKIAWAVRKENPELLASLNKFVQKHGQGTLLGNILIKRYYKDNRWIQNPTTAAEQKKLDNLKTLFKKYAKKYDFDWLKIAALAYQESGFDHSKKNVSGATGVMQVLPSTAADPHVGISNVNDLENNIHAGVKYLGFLRDRYFSDPHISSADRVDFTVAAYNAGPAKINALRRKAVKLNLDPNKWFFNVEHVARRVIGQETVQYVANINKYFIAFKSAEQINEERSIQLKKMGQPD
jgi:membrane-bound lytic murein transglycosylase MltF